MQLIEIARTSRSVADSSARSAKIGSLAATVARLRGDEIPVGVAYLMGELPQGRVGLGPATLHEVASTSPAVEPTLSVRAVDDAFEGIAGLSGPGSAREKARRLAELLSEATEEEGRFLRRLVLGELRQGALEGVMAEAVARAADVPASEIRRALMYSGSLPEVAGVALKEGKAGLTRFSIRLFRPVQPMLAATADEVGEALGRLGRARLEYKLDGARIQVHRSGDDVRVYTRRLNDVTAAVPEVVARVGGLDGVSEIILDGECLALKEDGSPQPFQVTMRRFGRKLDVERMRREQPLTSFYFDCLYLDGQDLTCEETRERLAALSRLLPADLAIPSIETGDPEEADSFMRSAIEAGHEGVMAKALDAAYEAGRRGSSWLKLKRTHTLDLVVLAAEWGSGRRRGWLSNIHLGARDPETGGFAMLGKTFKGMTDEMLEWQTRKLQELEVSRDEWTVYVRPELVAEIAFDGVQESPTYPGGLALRFARVKRYRPDKSPDQADTIGAVRRIHKGEGSRRR